MELIVKDKELIKLNEYLSEEGQRYLQSLLDKRDRNISKRSRIKLKNSLKSKELLEKRANKFRNKLIKNQTNAELAFKALLKLANIKYEFQKIIFYNNSFYIVDFYIPDKNVVIEIDGNHHDIVKDKVRTENLLREGISRVHRFKNATVHNTAYCLRKLNSIMNN